MPADPRVPLVEFHEAVNRLCAAEASSLLADEEVNGLLASVIAANEPAPTSHAEAHTVVDWARRIRAQAKILELVLEKKMTIGAWFQPSEGEEDTFHVQFRVGGRPMTLDEAASLLCSFEQEKLGGDEKPGRLESF